MKGIFDNKYWEDKIENIIYIYVYYVLNVSSLVN